MFGRKKASSDYKEFDLSEWEPLLKCSICNGEQVAEFKNMQTGQVEEVAFIRSPEELQAFLDAYGLEDIKRVY